jgi:hypothetical protein
MLETALFNPIKEYLEKHGYAVNAEVKDCDITAVRGKDLVIIELKTSANMQLLIQATSRQRITDSVYIAVPAPRKRSKHWLGIQRVVKQLELGLITVSFSPSGPIVQKLFDPMPAQRRKSAKKRRAIIKEIAGRQIDVNIGGSSQAKLLTAYRQSALLIAAGLELIGACSAKKLRSLGTGEKTLSILSNNHYGWFQRIERGIYELTELGQKEIQAFPDLYASNKTFINTRISELAIESNEDT